MRAGRYWMSTHTVPAVQRQTSSAAPHTPAGSTLAIPWTGSTQSSIFDFLRTAGLDEERASLTRSSAAPGVFSPGVAGDGSGPSVWA